MTVYFKRVSGNKSGRSRCSKSMFGRLNICLNPLLHFVQPAVRLISAKNLRFSASGGPPEPPSKLVQSILLNVDALAGIAKPARASETINIDTPMNAEALAGLAPKGLAGLFEACS